MDCESFFWTMHTYYEWKKSWEMIVVVSYYFIPQTAKMSSQTNNKWSMRKQKAVTCTEYVTTCMICYMSIAFAWFNNAHYDFILVMKNNSFEIMFQFYQY